TLTPLFQEKRITVTTKFPSPLLVLGNRDRLAQVLTNLLHNAILFSKEGSTIILEGEENNGTTTIAVLDEGPGIPEGDIPFIFERFYRVDKSRSRKGGGMGLGLAIVREIVEHHGGKVGVVNRPQGGSRFFFTLQSASVAELGQV
ncbi:MAG: ATP-binding protein, partial [Atribacterota bacterium]